ncbi:MAG: PqqD family protein [Oscillospiraceae bacterium]|jgi:hypothetical protein|nr:PqqD family protein [Oscillospiraceae bacterium]
MYITLNEGFIVRKIDEEILILNVEQNGIYSLNGVASAIWEALNRSKRIDIETLLKEIEAEYEVDSNMLRTDVLDFIDKMKTFGLFSVTNLSP